MQHELQSIAVYEIREGATKPLRFKVHAGFSDQAHSLLQKVPTARGPQCTHAGKGECMQMLASSQCDEHQRPNTPESIPQSVINHVPGTETQEVLT